MEGLTRLVSESLARHGFDRPLDYRRLKWSRWFRCESPHSLLFVPSQPGVFALAEEVMNLSDQGREGHDLSHADKAINDEAAVPAEGRDSARMLAVSQFFEADDMAFVLDRMLSYQNPMRARLASGRYFVRYVVIEDHSQRRSIASALNQWISSSAERATGIGSHFASSLELTPTVDAVSQNKNETRTPSSAASATTAPQPNSGAATNINCPAPFPSGF